MAAAPSLGVWAPVPLPPVVLARYPALHLTLDLDDRLVDSRSAYRGTPRHPLGCTAL